MSISIRSDTSGTSGAIQISGVDILTVSQTAVAVVGTAMRFTADFSNATLSNRLMFQTSTANSPTSLGVIPNGAGAYSSYIAWLNSDPTNSPYGSMYIDGNGVALYSSKVGTGSYLPLLFNVGGTERMRIDTSGNVTYPSPASGSFKSLAKVDDSLSANSYVIVNNGASVWGSTWAGLGIGTGNAYPLVFATSAAERMRIDTNGSVAIGTSTILSSARFVSSGGRSYFAANSDLYAIGVAYNSTRYAAGQAYYFGATDSTTPDAVFSDAGGIERVRITSNGNLLVTGAGGLGYGTGSGGTVTQATSKSTSVTLNKPSGQITMNGASLAANTTVVFNCTNSLCAATDAIVANLKAGGGTPGSYNVWAVPGAGGFDVYVRNISASALAEILVINFAIIKGATS